VETSGRLGPEAEDLLSLIISFSDDPARARYKTTVFKQHLNLLIMQWNARKIYQTLRGTRRVATSTYQLSENIHNQSSIRRIHFLSLRYPPPRRA